MTKAFLPSNEMMFTTVEADRQRLLCHCRGLEGTVLTLNLGAVDHCDSAGLAFLIEAKRLAAQHGKTCRIEDMPKSVHALAEFCGVDKMLALGQERWNDK